MYFHLEVRQEICAKNGYLYVSLDENPGNVPSHAKIQGEGLTPVSINGLTVRCLKFPKGGLSGAFVRIGYHVNCNTCAHKNF